MAEMAPVDPIFPFVDFHLESQLMLHTKDERVKILKPVKDHFHACHKANTNPLEPLIWYLDMAKKNWTLYKPKQYAGILISHALKWINDVNIIDGKAVSVGHWEYKDFAERADIWFWCPGARFCPEHHKFSFGKPVNKRPTCYCEDLAGVENKIWDPTGWRYKYRKGWKCGRFSYGTISEIIEDKFPDLYLAPSPDVLRYYDPGQPHWKQVAANGPLLAARRARSEAMWQHIQDLARTLEQIDGVKPHEDENREPVVEEVNGEDYKPIKMILRIRNPNVMILDGPLTEEPESYAKDEPIILRIRAIKKRKVEHVEDDKENVIVKKSCRREKVKKE